ncbi:MAG: calcium/proton exchanger [Candidatus Obscuribacterales bacterium]|nr:calcium/proton exchanger [Candidatus Obscuribacterales bacterium]
MNRLPAQGSKRTVPSIKLKNLLSQVKITDLFLVFIPVAFYAASKHMHILGFFGSCLAIIPLAGLMGRATEYLSDRLGTAPGALLNATFGNACEFIIALAALRAGYVDVVKASITGSIIGNILLVLGASMLAGGIKFQTQLFNRVAASTSATLLALAAISLMVPSIFHHFSKSLANEDDLALGISVILFLIYILSLFFNLKTHKHLYNREVDEVAEEAIGVHGWGPITSTVVLLVCTVMVAVLSEILVHGVENVASELHINKIFIGVILVAIIGNAAEHSTAVYMAVKNKMDLSLSIALGSGAQIALLVAPLLVFISNFIGKPMNLYFSEFEVMAIALSVIILQYVTNDGECNWMEGAQLLAVYAILGITFFFV